MKKLLTFLTLLTLFFTVGWAADQTIIVDFESQAFPTGWTNSNFEVVSNPVSSNSNNYAASTGGKTSATLTYDTKLTGVKSISVDATRTSNNTNSNLYIQYSTDNTNWIDAKQVTITKNSWTTTTYSFDNATSCYVRICWKGTTAIKYIDNIVITYDSDAGSQTTVGIPVIIFDAFTAGKTTSTVTITPGENATSTSYKIGDGTYQSYTSQIGIDLTEVASPITVYAKSSDGTNESSEVSATFTLPALGLSISPSSYNGYAAQTVTMTASNYVGESLISYTINGGAAQDYTDPFPISEPGTYEIEATVLDERAGGSTVSKTATITIKEAEGVNLPFVETFNETDGTGGNDGTWNGSVATSTIVYDNEGWSVSDKWGGKQCIRLGTGSKKGTITSPTIKGLTIGETYTLTFKAAPWGTASTIMNVTASGATVSGLPTEAMNTEQWNDFTVTLTATATTTTITFTADQNRFWLDEVNVNSQQAPVADGYYLFGQFNSWDTDDSNYKFTQQSDGSYVLVVSNYSANNQFKFAKYENGTATLIGVSNGGNNYGLHSTHHTGIAMNTGEDTYSINDGGEMIFTIHADGTAFDVDKQVYIKGSYNEWANEAMELTADGWKITKHLAANTELGFQDTWGNGIWHGCGDNQQNITVDASKLGTDLALWTDGKNFVMESDANYTFVVSRDLSKVVITRPYIVTCTAITDIEGKIGGTVTADKETANPGETVTLTINTNSGYTLDRVIVNSNDITPVEGVYSFTMPQADAEVKAYFTTNVYTITVDNDNTMGAVVGLQSTAHTGETVEFEVSPVEGYTIKSVTASFINANNVETAVPVTENNGVYSFGMPPFNVTVKVTYKAPIAPCTIPFTETWNETVGSGGHDGGFGTSSGTIVSDNEGWTFLKGDAEGASYTEFTGFGADKCIRIGERSESGKAVSPTILVTNGTIYQMTFDVAPWGSDDNEFNISATGAELYSDEACTQPISSLSNVTGTWTTYTVYVKATASSMNITWEALPNKHRFFLDDVNINYFATPEYTEVTLAELCATGVTTEGSNKYVISDMLQAVYADDIRGLLWCKDLGNKSISSTSMHEGDQVDFLMNDNLAQNGRAWDQSNWILLSFSTPDMENGVGQLVDNARDKFIKPGTIKGTLVNNTNYTLKMELDQLDLVTQADAGYSEEPYEENVYCPSNFLPENLNIWGSIEAGDGGYTTGNDQNYFFMNPKVQEVCYITYAEWNQEKNCFTVPTKSGFKGAFQVGWAYKTTNTIPTVQDGKDYKFHAVVQRTDKEHYGPNNPISAKDELPYSEYITVLPVDLTGDDNIITAINTVEAGKGEVKSVKYVNVAGVVSDAPFQGVNIVVTEYTDGTRTTSKMLRK